MTRLISPLWTCAEIALLETRIPVGWVDDVAHDAMLILVRQLQKRTDLGYDRHRPAREFANWIRTIMFRQCKEAIRSLRRRHGRDLTLELEPAGERNSMIEQQIDVRMAIDKLDEPVRTIMFLTYGGLSIREIANRLELSYDQIRYARTQAYGILKRQLQTGYRID
jgi:RNA polymerase sigma factor (sigma-70 family)